jgi:ATP-dependent RNA helicase DDX24/MAK5
MSRAALIATLEHFLVLWLAGYYFPALARPNLASGKSLGLLIPRTATMLSLKRKKNSGSGLDAARKRKRVLVDDLSWKEVQRPQEAGLDELEGMLMLEEVDDVEVVYEEIGEGRIARFNVRPYCSEGERCWYSNHLKAKTTKNDEEEEWLGIQDSSSVSDTSPPDPQDTQEASSSSSNVVLPPVVEEADAPSLPEWEPFALDNWLLRGIAELGFAAPTAIQNSAIPLAMEGRDVIGIAQTVEFRIVFMMMN